MNHLDNFKIWLKSKKYNQGTIRNYICDINKYLRFTKKHFSSPKNSELFIFSEEAFGTYVLHVADEKNSLRYFTSLAKYSQYALEKKIIATNNFKIVRKQVLHHRNTHLDPIVQLYQTNLTHQNKTSATIKNYINDVQQFINWSNPIK